MKKTTVLLKHVLFLLGSIAKAKSIVIKNKKLLLGSISNKIQKLLSGDHHDSGDEGKAIVCANGNGNGMEESCTQVCDNDNDNYPDLTHSLFNEDDEFDYKDEGGSIIDMVRKSKEEGVDFSLEDEIDHVADLFIMRFHKQMRLQKLLSFKRYQERSD